MPSTMDKCKLFRIKHTTLLEGKTFLRNKHKITFFLNKMHIFFGRKENTIKKKKNFQTFFKIKHHNIKEEEKKLLLLSISFPFIEQANLELFLHAGGYSIRIACKRIFLFAKVVRVIKLV